MYFINDILYLFNVCYVSYVLMLLMGGAFPSPHHDHLCSLHVAFDRLVIFRL